MEPPALSRKLAEVLTLAVTVFLRVAGRSEMKAPIDPRAMEMLLAFDLVGVDGDELRARPNVVNSLRPHLNPKFPYRVIPRDLALVNNFVFGLAGALAQFLDDHDDDRDATTDFVLDGDWLPDVVGEAARRAEEQFPTCPPS